MTKKESSRLWYLKNRERLLLKASEYRKTLDPKMTLEYLHEWHNAHPDKRALYRTRIKPAHMNKLKRAYYKRHAERLKALSSFRRAGITLQQFLALAEKQGGACAICRRIPDRRLDVDHCHTHSHVRGLLCRHCNLGLGNFKDSIEILRYAIEYLSTTADPARDSMIISTSTRKRAVRPCPIPL